MNNLLRVGDLCRLMSTWRFLLCLRCFAPATFLFATMFQCVAQFFFNIETEYLILLWQINCLLGSNIFTTVLNNASKAMLASCFFLQEGLKFVKGEALPPILYTDLRGSPYFPSKFNQNVLLYSLFTCNNCHHAFVLQDFYTFCYLNNRIGRSLKKKPSSIRFSLSELA